jgi:hypothetical protein
LVHEYILAYPEKSLQITQPATRDYSRLSNKIKTDMVYNWTIDLAVPPTLNTHADTELLVDVDHYLDMNFYLREPRTVFMYSFQPTKPAGVMDEYSWAFRKNGTARYVLASGDRFEHDIWNWTSNSMFISRGLFSTTIYWVDSQTAASPEHRVVVLTPMFTFGPLGTLFLRLFNFSEAVTRYAPHVGFGKRSFHVIEYGTHINLCTTDSAGTALPGYTYTGQELGAAMCIIQGSTNSSATTILSALELDKTPARACLLHDYLLVRADQKFTDPFEPTVVGKGGNTITYTITGTTITSRIKGMFLPVTSERTCCVGESGEPGPLSALGARVQPGREIADRSNSFLYNELVKDFAKELFPNPIDPVGLDVVLDTLNKTKHKRQRERFPPDGEKPEHTRGVLLVKAEPYPKIAPARPLIAFDSRTVHAYSQYTLAIADRLATTDWYAFGRSPSQLTDKLALMIDKVSTKHQLVETDYSGFDTTIGGIRNFEEIIFRHAFTGNHLEKVLALWRGQHFMRVSVEANQGEPLGYYISEGERLSGSAETSCLNTIDNAIVGYIANRQSGLNHKDSWHQLGLYGGDDGIAPSINPAVLESVAKTCGLALKATIRPRGSPYCFLGRYYNNWTGDKTSYYDPVRALTRIQYTDDKTVTVEQALQRKVSALSITDSRTPWVKNIIKKYLENYGSDYPLLEASDLGYSSENWVALQCLQHKERIFQSEITPDWAMALYPSCLKAAELAFEDSLKRATSINGVPTGNKPVVCNLIHRTRTSVGMVPGGPVKPDTPPRLDIKRREPDDSVPVGLKKGTNPTRTERTAMKRAIRSGKTTPSSPSPKGDLETTPLVPPHEGDPKRTPSVRH